MKWFILLALLLLLPCAGQGRIRLQRSSTGIDGHPVLVSDGAQETASRGFIVKPSSGTGLQRFWSSTSCDETYGFMPCTTTVVGNLFLLLAYGYPMFKAATFITNGCELLLVVMGSGIIGGLFLPILGAFPDALLIAVSGLSGSTETAQSQVLIGMGLLAGSTVMLLTALWGACLIVGKCNISGESATATDSEDTKRFDLSGSGITTDKATSKASQIMMLSIIPFIIVEIPQVIKSSSGQRIAVLVACIAAVVCVLSYCMYQVLQPWIQNRRLAYAKQKRMISSILKVVQKKAYGKLLQDDGKPDHDVLIRIFKTLDDDNDRFLSKRELRGLLVGLELQDPEASRDSAVDKVMADFDSSRDDQLSEEEFINGMSRWLLIATSTVGPSDSYSTKFMSNFHSRTKEDLDALEQGNEEVTEVDNPHKVYLKAVMLMLGGAILAAIFADPLVDAVDNFSTATSIPSFFISFIIMPLATNSSEGVSALIFASRKTKRTASLTYSEIYGAVTMNNTLCLGVFLAIIYFRDLDWDFSAEVLVILLVIIVMGLLSSFRTTFPLWMSFIAFLLYPLTLAIVYVLDYVLGWS